MAGSSLIGNLAVTLGLNTAAFERGATKAEARARTLQGRMAKIGDTMKGFAGGLVAGIGIAGITSIAAGAFKMASALDESAQKMGVTVEALQELNLAAQQSGVSQETLSGAMARLNKNLGALQQGAKPAVEAFAKLGLSAEDLKNKSPDQALRLIADALNKLPSVQERVAVGQQIMGRSFSELLPLINGGSAALDKYAETSRNQGQITTEEARRLDELADTWDRLKIRVGVAAAKIIAMFAELSSKLDEAVLKWYAWRDGTLAAIGDLASSAVARVQQMVSGIAQAITGRLGAVWENAKARINEVKQKFNEMYDAVVGHSYVPDMVAGIAQEFARLSQIMVDPSVSATDKVAAAFQGLQSAISQILGDKAGGIFSMITQMVSAFGPLLGNLFGGNIFAGGMPGAGAAAAGWGNPVPLIGMARGGGGVFGGMPGVDKNVLSLNGSPIARVSKGEQWTVGQAANDQPQHVVIELRNEMLDAKIAQGANVQIARTYPAMRADTLKAVGDKRRRSP